MIGTARRCGGCEFFVVEKSSTATQVAQRLELLVGTAAKHFNAPIAEPAARVQFGKRNCHTPPRSGTSNTPCDREE